MKIDLNTLQEYESKKLIRCQSHPSLNLLIWNYTQRCQGEKTFDEITMMCRGLITDLNGKIIARPFNKFFNWDEHDSPSLPNIPSNENFSAYDKADGSLGISYPVPSGYALATRGSFESEQAKYGTSMLKDTSFFKDGYTYLFEIIYPENRIVVDYKGDKKLILLGARSIESGEIISANFIDQDSYETPKKIRDFKKPRDNAEGVVLYFQSGFMVKVKYDEYVRLHRLVTGVTTRRIWDLLRNNEPVEEMIERVPEEFEKWVKETIKNLTIKYEVIEIGSILSLGGIKKLKTRKEQAIEIMKNHKDLSSILFAMLDDKPYDQIIWKLIKPKAESPFREDM